MQVEMGSMALKLIVTTAESGQLSRLERKEDAGRPQQILSSESSRSRAACMVMML